MELAADERAGAHLGDEAFRPRRRAGRDRRIRMGEVERAAAADLRPAHAGHTAFLDAHRAARNETEPLHPAVLPRPFERQLQAEADAEHRAPRRDAGTQRLVMAAVAQPRHRRARRSDPGKHRKVGGGDVRDDRCSEPLERELDRTDVAGPVLADRDPHRTPFVDGRPAPSRATATRSARPTALNAASATWCASRPEASTWIEARAACARVESMCTAIPGSASSVSSAWARPPRSTAARASASSIGTTASP